MKSIQQTEQLSDRELKAVLRGDEASAGRSGSRSAPPTQSRAWTRSSSARCTSASWRTARTMRPSSRWTCSAATTSRRGWDQGRGWWRWAGKSGGGWDSKSEPGRHFFLSMDRKKGDKASSCYPLLTQTIDSSPSKRNCLYWTKWILQKESRISFKILYRRINNSLAVLRLGYDLRAIS